jgi:hypothetical protein
MMNKAFAVALWAVAFLSVSEGRAQTLAKPCETPAIVAMAGTSIRVPVGHTTGTLVDKTGKPVASFTAARPEGGSWTPTAEQIKQMADSRTAAGTDPLFVSWSGGAAGTECTQTFQLALDDSRGDGARARGPVAPRPLADPAENARASGTAWPERGCGQAGARWEGEIRRELGSDDFTQIVFLEDRGVCYRGGNRDYGVTGNPIYIGVFTEDAQVWDEVSIQYEPCAIESAVPAVLVNDKASVLSGFQSGLNVWVLRTYPQRSCFNTTVGVTVTGRTGDKTVTARTSLEQAQRYRATVNLGTLFTDLHNRSFGLRPDGTGQRIYGQGPTDTGPEYYAAVVLYGLPYYLPSLLGGERYRGRDVIHENGLLDRIGGVIGVGISDPRKQFVAGFAFEALAGVSVTGTWNFMRVNKLAGVNEDDLFTGAADRIPQRQEWDREFAVGVSLDLRYVSALVTR